MKKLEKRSLKDKYSKLWPLPSLSKGRNRTKTNIKPPLLEIEWKENISRIEEVVSGYISSILLSPFLQKCMNEDIYIITQIKFCRNQARTQNTDFLAYINIIFLFVSEIIKTTNITRISFVIVSRYKFFLVFFSLCQNLKVD